MVANLKGSSSIGKHDLKLLPNSSTRFVIRGCNSSPRSLAHCSHNTHLALSALLLLAHNHEGAEVIGRWRAREVVSSDHGEVWDVLEGCVKIWGSYGEYPYGNPLNRRRRKTSYGHTNINSPIRKGGRIREENGYGNHSTPPSSTTTSSSYSSSPRSSTSSHSSDPKVSMEGGVLSRTSKSNNNKNNNKNLNRKNRRKKKSKKNDKKGGSRDIDTKSLYNPSPESEGKPVFEMVDKPSKKQKRKNRLLSSSSLKKGYNNKNQHQDLTSISPPSSSNHISSHHPSLYKVRRRGGDRGRKHQSKKRRDGALRKLNESVVTNSQYNHHNLSNTNEGI